MINTWKDLRNKYPKFVFDSCSWKRQDHNLALEFMYSTPPHHKFTHKMVIENFPPSLEPTDFENFLFHIGLALMPSYWKATCSPITEIRAGHLTSQQIAFWHKLFIKGMGEYYYKNLIDFTPPDFLKITSTNANRMTINANRMTINDKVLIPLGGGKDSLVTLELLKPNFSVTGFVFNPVPAIKKIVKTAKIPVIFVQSCIDPYLIELNKQGYLNGHTPLSALLAFVSVFVAAFSKYKYVAISNERSTEENNTTYLGHAINHQYSKTLEFETDFQKYIYQHMAPDITYFSFLRPLYELQITRLFSHYPQYFGLFTSCNKNFIIDPKLHPHGLWCKTCPKCVSLALLLTPWIGKDKVVQIMGGYPPDMPQNQEILKGLRGEISVKPFECVLTRAEALGTIDMNSWLDNPNMPPQFIRILKIASAEKVLILGYGREGQSTYKFLQSRFPYLQIDTADQKDGLNYLEKIANHQVIFKTPGIKPHFPEIRKAKKQGKLITSQTQIFFYLCPGKIIGVTGTKGKSTTASLIYHVLSQNGIPSVLVGNIGKPMLDYLPEINSDTWVIAELSSFQLMDLKKSPHIAVLQNIYPDHLDYHKDFNEYKNAKMNIIKYQRPGDYFIHDLPLPDKPIESQLLGKHNQLNILPSIEIGKILKIPQEKILESIKKFVPLDNRLQSVAIKKGIEFYVDTLATIPEATMAAIDTLNPQTLIAGGHDRHQDYTALGKKIDASNINTLILFPNTGKKIWQSIGNKSIQHFLVGSMDEAIKIAFEKTLKGKICLLSPAAPSFTLFKDYIDEAEQYKKCILNLSVKI